MEGKKKGMKVEFYHNSKTQPRPTVVSSLDTIFKLLEDLKKRGVDVRVYDVSTMDDKSRFMAYYRMLAGPATMSLFCSKEADYRGFCTEVPGLAVYANPQDKYPRDAFPRVDPTGRLIVIEEALGDLLKKLIEGSGST